MAMPPSDMMFAVSPMCFIGMNASRTAMGSSRAGTSVERKCSRKSRITRVTTISSSISVCLSVSMLARMSVERSYVGTIWTPLGSVCLSSSMRAFTASMT